MTERYGILRPLVLQMAQHYNKNNIIVENAAIPNDIALGLIHPRKEC